MNITFGEAIGAGWALNANANDRAAEQAQATVLSGYVARGMTLSQAQAQLASDQAFANRGVNPHRVSWVWTIAAMLWCGFWLLTLSSAGSIGLAPALMIAGLFMAPGLVVLFAQGSHLKRHRTWNRRRRQVPLSDRAAQRESNRLADWR